MTSGVKMQYVAHPLQGELQWAPLMGRKVQHGQQMLAAM